MSPEMLKIIDDKQGEKATVVEGVFRMYDEPNSEKFKYCVVCLNEKEMILEQELSGIGSNPYIVFRWNKASGEVFGRGQYLMLWLQSKQQTLQ